MYEIVVYPSIYEQWRLLERFSEDFAEVLAPLACCIEEAETGNGAKEHINTYSETQWASNSILHRTVYTWCILRIFKWSPRQENNLLLVLLCSDALDESSSHIFPFLNSIALSLLNIFCNSTLEISEKLAMIHTLISTWFLNVPSIT